jgi:hypothetical protein
VSNYTSLSQAIADRAVIIVTADIAFPAQIVIPANWTVTISGATVDTTLDGGGATRHFYVEGTLILEDMILANGWADPSGQGQFPNTVGGAVFLANGAKGNFTRTTFTSNSASLGGAVDIELGASGAFVDSAFFSNYGATHGGGIFLSNAGGTAYVSGTEFGNNTAGYGGNDIFNMHSDPSEVQCPSTCGGEDCTTIDCYECTCYSCSCFHPSPHPTKAPAPTYSSAPTTSSADAAVCSEDSTCTAPCDACCVSYISDQATCDACVESECSTNNTCSDDAMCSTCDACCVSYFLDQADCDACVESEC